MSVGPETAHAHPWEWGLHLKGIMKELMLNAFSSIEDLISPVKVGKERDAIYMVYVPKETDHLVPGMQVYIGDPPGFDDDDEVLPAPVVALGLEPGYMREQLQDVVDLAIKQKPSATDEEIVRCLNHYAEFDDFLDLDQDP